jgi:hypothetical protein
MLSPVLTIRGRCTIDTNLLPTVENPNNDLYYMVLRFGITSRFGQVLSQTLGI